MLVDSLARDLKAFHLVTLSVDLSEEGVWEVLVVSRVIVAEDFDHTLVLFCQAHNHQNLALRVFLISDYESLCLHHLLERLRTQNLSRLRRQKLNMVIETDHNLS
jgi:hypothetical protein